MDVINTLVDAISSSAGMANLVSPLSRMSHNGG